MWLLCLFACHIIFLCLYCLGIVIIMLFSDFCNNTNEESKGNDDDVLNDEGEGMLY